MKKIIPFLLLVSYFVSSQEVISEEVKLNNNSIELPGTLSYPNQEEQVPLVIFIHGSGNIDRNGNQGDLAKADYIKILADSLNTKGIAFYRYDKRTSNPNNFEYLKKIRFQDLIDDAIVVINHFKNDLRFNSMHLIGHSQGSLVAMLAAKKDIKSYISLAGPGTSIRQTLIKQVSAQNKDLSKATAQHIEELIKTDTIQEVNPFLISVFAPQNQKFLKEWMLYNPSEEIKKLKIPIAIINGNADLQVSEEDANLLHQAKLGSLLILIEKMNHVLKIVENLPENQKSYIDPDFPISIKLINLISEFIKENE